MTLFKISWWIHGAGKIVRGFDLIRAEKLDKDSATELIEKDLERDLRDPESMTADLYDFPSDFIPNLPKFHAKFHDLGMSDRHSEISNWGILKILEAKQLGEKR